MNSGPVEELNYLDFYLTQVIIKSFDVQMVYDLHAGDFSFTTCVLSKQFK